MYITVSVADFNVPDADAFACCASKVSPEGRALYKRKNIYALPGASKGVVHGVPTTPLAMLSLIRLEQLCDTQYFIISVVQ